MSGLPRSNASVFGARTGVGATAPKTDADVLYVILPCVRRDQNRDADHGDIHGAAHGVLQINAFAARRWIGNVDFSQKTFRAENRFSRSLKKRRERLALFAVRESALAGRFQYEQRRQGFARRRSAADVAADGRRVAHLQRCELMRRFPKHRQFFAHESAGFEIADRRQRADAQAAAVLFDAAQAGELLDIHQRARLFLEFNVHHHVRAAGDDFGFGAVLREHGQRFAYRFWFEIFHNRCLSIC